jgi:CRP-like cAMP-binding protein
MANNSGAAGPYRNALLSQLPQDILERLSPHPVDLPVPKVLFEPNEEIEHAYFPESGVLSIVSLMSDGGSIEVGTIGRDGMAGSVLVLHENSMPYRCFVQVGGHGYRVGASKLLAAARASEELQTLLLKFEAAFRTQTMQGMACNGLHHVEQRCCRWLLMTRDRVDSDDLKLTHEFLGLMLGVRRSSVTEVLAPLQEMGLVQSIRGTITILNRKALEARVCECYWVMTPNGREA